MSSGQKTLVFNTRERVLSTDYNRLQSFVATDRAALFQAFFGNRRFNFYESPGVVAVPSAVSTPLQADVYGGVMVDPQATSLLITPGVVGCWFPDPGATADDGPYMMLNEPGLQLAGVLTFTANSGPGARVDVVECQPVASVLESDNRDIFAPSTGLFSPVAVPKVQRFQMQYRIRLGTPGSGLPASVSGWLPLAVFVVSTAAVDFSTCDFYDVRPLVEERVGAQPGSSGSGQGNHVPYGAEFCTRVSSGAMLVGGYAWGDYKGYRAGGVLRKSTPSFSGTFGGTGNGDGDLNAVNLDLAENQVTGFAHSAGAYQALCAFFPGDLPGWVRYSETSILGIGRAPRGPRGVVMVGPDANVNANGWCTATLPVFGSAKGCVLAVIKSNPAGSGFDFATTNAGWTTVAQPRQSAVVPSLSTTTLQWNVNRSLDYPQAAKALRLRVWIDATVVASSVGNVAFQLKNSAGNIVSEFAYAALTQPAAGAASFVTTIEIVLLGRNRFDDSTPDDWSLLAATAGIGTPVTTSRFAVAGWRMGPS